VTEQFKAATIRALYGALLTTGSVFFVSLQTLPAGAQRIQDSAIAAAAGFFSYMLARGVTEGLIDSNRGPTPADVGQPQA
jgi:hypothetical protein